MILKPVLLFVALKPMLRVELDKKLNFNVLNKEVGESYSRKENER